MAKRGFPSPAVLAEECAALLARANMAEGKAALLSSLTAIFGELAGTREAVAVYPELGALFQPFRRSLDGGDVEGVEDALTAIYAYLHGSGSSYSPEERSTLDAVGGYWCHAGGLSPLWRAAPWIRRETRVADYGAGNGLQGLLFQALYPHRSTTLIELSGPMVENGRRLGKLMNIPASKVSWVHGSVTQVPPEEFDFIYIYRPLRPEGQEGKSFYEWFADCLASVDHRVVIFSIADCLKDFLASPFVLFYDDGQLACFTNRPQNQGQTPV